MREKNLKRIKAQEWIVRFDGKVIQSDSYIEIEKKEVIDINKETET